MSWDIELDSNGKMPLYPRLFRGPRKIAQAVRIAVRMHDEEHLPDATKGMRYREWIEDRWEPLQAIGGQIRRELAEVPGIDEVTNFSISKTGGEIQVSATLTTRDGEEFGVRVTSPVEPRGNIQPSVFFTFTSRTFV